MASRRVVRVAVPGFAPFSLRVHPPGELVSDHLARTGAWEPYESSLLAGLLQPGDVVLDVGANLGYYSRLAAQAVGPAGQVLAFEPDAQNFALLAANTDDLAQVTAHRCGLGEGRGRVSVAGDPANRGDLFLVSDATGRVRMMPGDDLALPRIDLLKIDVQGGEVGVLLGLRQTLARSRGALALLIEAWPYGLERCGSSAGALLEALLALDMPTWLVDHEGFRLSPLDVAGLHVLMLETLTVEQGGFVNLLLGRKP